MGNVVLAGSGARVAGHGVTAAMAKACALTQPRTSALTAAKDVGVRHVVVVVKSLTDHCASRSAVKS